MIDVITYHAVNCPYCKEMELGAILANSALPLGRKIILMDYHSSERWNDLTGQTKIIPYANSAPAGIMWTSGTLRM